MPQYHDLYADVYGSNFDRALKLQAQIAGNQQHDAALAETIRAHRASELIQNARYLQAAREHVAKTQDAALADSQANYTANTANPPAGEAVTAPEGFSVTGQRVGGEPQWTARADALRSKYFADHPIEQPGPSMPYKGGQRGLASYLSSARPSPYSPQAVAADLAKKENTQDAKGEPKEQAFKDVISGAGLPADDVLSATNIWTKTSRPIAPDPATGNPGYEAGAAAPAELSDTIAIQHPQKGYMEFKPSFPMTSTGKPSGGPANVITAYNKLKGRGKVSPAPADSGPARVSSVQDAMRLPSGTIFIDPSGKTRKVP